LPSLEAPVIPGAEEELVAVFDQLVSKLVRTGRIHLDMPGQPRRSFGPGGGKELTVRIADRRTAFAIARNPRLGLGEAYMDGRLTIADGTILDLMEIIVGSNRWEDGGGGRKAINKGKRRLLNLFKTNNPIRARRNVAHHYDLKDELYELFLDDDLQYSCAYFTDPSNSLEQAQADKKAHIAAKLDLRAGQRVLDIGCGWGGMALYLNRVAGVDVLGVTLSERQLEVARARAAKAGVSDRVRFELIDYRHLDQTFDRIVSVGMFEHVGLDHYEEFFAKCRDLLAPEGVMLLHTIGKLGNPSKAPDPFTDKYIFPGYHLPSLDQMAAASEKVRLISSDVETLRRHYGYTLRHWLDRVRGARKQIEAMYDDRFFRMWEFYLSGGVVMFESGAACNFQVQYIRDRNAVPITRDYMAEAEQRYRALDAAPAPAKKKARAR
jgi:cyclopropane-fatty-acyl-phospholipid synthase